jgi:hypothetical protein
MDLRDVVLEIRAGTGGSEAALFASDLLDAYRRYFSAAGFSSRVLDVSESDEGGVKAVSLAVAGEAVYVPAPPPPDPASFASATKELPYTQPPSFVIASLPPPS